jgi:hypothetical protein
MKMPQAPQDWEELASFPRLLAQLVGAPVCTSDLLSRLALECHQYWPKRRLQRQLVPETLRGIRKRPEEFETPGQVGTRFHIG